MPSVTLVSFSQSKISETCFSFDEQGYFSILYDQMSCADLQTTAKEVYLAEPAAIKMDCGECYLDSSLGQLS